MATSAPILEHVSPLPRREAHARQSVSILSPLRYPGGKRRLAAYVAKCLELNDLQPDVFTEAFAGGASVTLQLLQDDVIESAVLGEKDPDVVAFWDVVFNDHEWLCEQVESIDVTLAEWTRMKASRPRTPRNRALRCLFLNRTSFSGILQPNAGPIGGKAQESDYSLDCRWTPSTLVRRIEQAAALADRVLCIFEGSWQETVAWVKRRKPPHEVFYYFDPPFYGKGARLYRHAFNDADHRALKRGIDRLESDWLLSYDPAPFIVDLYEDHGRRHLEFLYSTSGTEQSRGRASELVITSLERTPRATRLWRTHDEWKHGR